MQHRHIFSSLLAGTALALAPQAVAAQDAARDKLKAMDGPNTPTESGDKATADQNGDIVVTGSRIRGAAVAGDIITLDQEAIIAAGQVDLGEAIRSLPQNFSGGQNPGVGSGGGLINNNINSGSHANLRGLGPDATLTLLNGHRLPYDSAFGGVDISAVPLAALDRIEVVPDGASALYGSDAVAGVVNVILRSDFDGVATSAQIGASTDGGNFRQQADIVGGKTWNGGGFLIAYDFAHNSEIRARQRSYATSLDPNATLYPSLNRHAVTFGRYFFMDVAKDGIALYEADDRLLHVPKPKTPEQAVAMAKEYFEEWLPSASDFYDGYRDAVARGKLKKAVFDLHQSAERMYHTVLLVCTFYTPHVHNLGFLRTQAERLDMRLVDCWPRELRPDRARFEKLKEAYVKARYSKHYRISEEELMWLGEQIEELGRVVHTICSERIAALENEVRTTQ